jgi:hypothetical protein
VRKNHFYTATYRRSCGATWPSFAPALIGRAVCPKCDQRSPITINIHNDPSGGRFPACEIFYG